MWPYTRQKTAARWWPLLSDGSSARWVLKLWTAKIKQHWQTLMRTVCHGTDGFGERDTEKRKCPMGSERRNSYSISSFVSYSTVLIEIYEFRFNIKELQLSHREGSAIHSLTLVKPKEANTEVKTTMDRGANAEPSPQTGGWRQNCSSECELYF